MAEYGNIVVTVRAPTVDDAPDRALITLALIAHPNSHLWIQGDRIYVGHNPDGKPIYYRVTGWEPDPGALIVERERP
jgi:hypothetical protein